MAEGGAGLLTFTDLIGPPDGWGDGTVARYYAFLWGPYWSLGGVLPFSLLYRTSDEFAAEIANRTIHGVLHLGWVEDAGGRWRGQMAMLVKVNGLPGRAYMSVIKPFRYLIVYPALMRRIEAHWSGLAGRVTRPKPDVTA
ncbi:MAG TPA: DUF2867 domain-containing protein [Kribbella sp.]|nr:DUF2867 domain-containing protein [Kribbella sp.]